MKYKMFELVVLEHDLPEHRLHRGDVGTIVELYEPDGIEVEFVDPSGHTRAVVTLSVGITRPAGDEDLVKAGKRSRSQ
jgi:hypothetical protein